MAGKNIKGKALKKSKLFSCDLCNKEFSRNSYLQFHKLSHLDTNPFQCKVCGKVFERNFPYKKHINTHNPKQKTKTYHNSEQKVFHCWVCDQTFTKRSALTNHQNFIHAKRFLCEVCGTQFVSQESLNSHHVSHVELQDDAETDVEKEKVIQEKLPLKIHTGKVFRCQLCTKLFALSSALEKHILAIHKPTKQFECKICHKFFSCSSTLRVHLRIHARSKPYICCLCKCAFARRDILVRHKQSHSNNQSSV